MLQSPLLSTKTACSLFDLKSAISGWLNESQYRRLSPQTVALQRIVTEKFVWWMEEFGKDSCGPDEIRAFLVYVTDDQPGGRYGIATETGEARPATTATYFERPDHSSG